MTTDHLLSILQPVLARVRRDVSALKAKGSRWSPDRDGALMWQTTDALTHARLVRHVEGAEIRGAYLIKPGERVCSAAVLDLDDHGGALTREELLCYAADIQRAALSWNLRGIPWVSSSGHGVHIWFLWDQPQDAYSVRECLKEVLNALGLSSGTQGLANSEVELFPKQDHVPEGGFGNQVWLPLGGKSAYLCCNELIDEFLRPVAPKNYDASIWVMSDAVPVLERPVQEALPAILPEDIEDALIEVADMLPSIKAYDYDNWIRVGFAIHNVSGGSDAGLVLWDNWSSHGPNYEPGVCSKRWGTMARGSGNDVGIGTLRMLAVSGGWVQDVSKDFQQITAAGLHGDPVHSKAPMPAFERDLEGRIKATAGNLIMALSMTEQTGHTLGYDRFRDELMVARTPGQWEQFTDVDYNRLKVILENNGRGMRPINRLDLRECVADVALRQQFDSAQLWLNSLVWDGVERVGGFLETYWATATKVPGYDRAVSEYMWTALAGRVLDPGCQCDMMPILVGEEGPGKSSSIRALVPYEDCFVELSFTDRDDDIARVMRGALVAEVAEMRGLGTRDEESIYTFVTRRWEKWVPKFKEFSTKTPRRTILFGTVNDAQFLGKEGRRWLPFNVGSRAGRSDSEVRPDLVARDRLQLWAEARELWRCGGVRWQAARDLGGLARAEFIISHPWEDRLRAWLVDYQAVIGGAGGFIATDKLFSQGLGLMGRFSSADARQLAKVMRSMGYEHARQDGQKGYKPVLQSFI